MAFKDLLVHLDDSTACAARLGAALALAKRQGASVTGVALALESTISKYVGIDFPSSLNEAQQEIVRKAAASAIAKFETAAGEAGVKCVSRRIACGATKAPAQLSFHARHADMTFMGQPDSNEPGGSFQESLLDGVMFASGRPVYIVPHIGRFEMPVRKAVIAWDGGKKAVRAVNDAIPLLEGRGGEVIILVINADQRRGAHGDNPGADIAGHLLRHGITAKIEKQIISEVSIDAAILNYLTDASADLLIMGAYGHSRLRERAFGGVTSMILQQMTTPVLMSE
ncbi:MAG: universal stress protein [Hyphomicrobiaceae bacterium]